MPELDVRPVLTSTFVTFFRFFHVFISIFIVCSILPILFLLLPMLPGGSPRTPAQELIIYCVFLGVWLTSAMFYFSLVSSASMAMINDEKPRFWSWARHGAETTRYTVLTGIVLVALVALSFVGPVAIVFLLARVIPALALVLVYYGFIMPLVGVLAVPALLLALRWSVALQIAQFERSAPKIALSRSRSLTQGNRWAIALTWSVLATIAVCAALVVDSFTEFTWAWMGGDIDRVTAETLWVIKIQIVAMAPLSLLAISAAQTYVQLSGKKDGPPAGQSVDAL